MTMLERLNGCVVLPLGIVLISGLARADLSTDRARGMQDPGELDESPRRRVSLDLTLDQIIVAELPEIRSLAACPACAARQGEREQRELALQVARLREELQKARSGKQRDAEAALLFKLAYLLEKANQHAQASELVRPLIEQHPDSRFVPLAYALAAEHFIHRREPDTALEFYRRIERYPQSSVFAYATFKTGWCQYDIGLFNAAVETFLSLVAIAEDEKTNDSKAHKVSLTKAARSSLVLAYAQAPGLRPDLAWPLFRRVGGDSAERMLEALAESYWDGGMFAESTTVYRQIISQHPADPRVCHWQNLIVRNATAGSSKADQLREIRQLAAVYDELGKRGAAKQTVEQCEKWFREVAKELARIWHQEAMHACFGDVSANPIALIELYLAHFPDDPDAPELRFRYAQLLTRGVREEWERAAILERMKRESVRK
jgi:cellulose synthase operon protein C